jgi:hypothetical protein
MLNFFNQKKDTIKEQETLINVDIMILDLLKKKENCSKTENKIQNKKEDKNKIKKIYRELNSFISN